MPTPNIMPRRIVCSVEDRFTGEEVDRTFVEEWTNINGIVCRDEWTGTCADYEEVRVVGVRKPTPAERREQAAFERRCVESDIRDGLLKSITREKSYTAARRAAGIK